STASDLSSRSRDITRSLHLKYSAKSFMRRIMQFILGLTFLPYDALMSTSAAVRSLYRVIISHKNLLEWRTSGEAEAAARNDLAVFFRSMWVSPLIGAGTAVILLVVNPGTLLFAFPFLCLWILSPFVAWWISQRIIEPPANLSSEQLQFLHHIARKTWCFFDHLVS